MVLQEQLNARICGVVGVITMSMAIHHPLRVQQSSFMKRSSVTLHIPQATKIGYIECPVWGVFDWNYPTSKLRRGRVQDGGVRHLP